MSMVHNRICVELKHTQSVVHKRRGVRLVGAQLYPRVACPVDMVHSYSRAQSVRAQSVVLNRYRVQLCGAQSVPPRFKRRRKSTITSLFHYKKHKTTLYRIWKYEKNVQIFFFSNTFTVIGPLEDGETNDNIL